MPQRTETMPRGAARTKTPLSKRQSRRSIRLLLIRHGQCESTAQKKPDFDDGLDAALSELGRAQCASLAHRLARQDMRLDEVTIGATNRLQSLDTHVCRNVCWIHTCAQTCV